MFRWAAPFLAILAAGLVNYGYWSYEGRPQQVPEAGIATVSSISFSPYLRGQSPFAKTPPSYDAIAREVEALAGRTAGLRTYSSVSGHDAVPRFARPLGMKVLQSAWVGRTPDETE